jgi:hypothetical protein
MIFIFFLFVHYKMEIMMDKMNVFKSIGTQFEAQSLNAVVAGFSFASAIAWMDLVRWMISVLIKVPKNGGTYFALTAIFTTLLSILIYLALSSVSKTVVKPQDPVYAVTAVR